MGKKRQIVQVDEDKLKMMMAGEIDVKAEEEDITIIDKSIQIPEINQEVPENAGMDEKKKNEPEEEAPPASDSNDTVKSFKRKKNKRLYTDIFLLKPPGTTRRQSSILLDEANYLNISRILKTTNGISITNFINNVLANHFEVYEEEIEEIMKAFINNLYRK